MSDEKTPNPVESQSSPIRLDLVAEAGERIDHFIAESGFTVEEHLYLLHQQAIRAMEVYKISFQDWCDTLEIAAQERGLLQAEENPSTEPPKPG